jgi:hypothetical protein
MAWTDTTLCSFCGKEIPIFRKFGNGQFCSKQHHDEYQKQQDQMAVDLLHRTHDALKAYRPVGSSIEDILGTGSTRPAAPPPVAPLYVTPAPATTQTAVAAPIAHVTRDDSREFDTASPAVFARLAGTPDKPVETPKAAEQKPKAKGPMDSSTFHFGDSMAKLDTPKVRKSLRSQLLAWILHNWPWRQSQKA